MLRSEVAGMKHFRSVTAVYGFTAVEAAEGIPHLLAEFALRELHAYDARWDAAVGKLLVEIETDDFGPRTSAWHDDVVWDCVIACVKFSSKGIRFERL